MELFENLFEARSSPRTLTSRIALLDMPITEESCASLAPVAPGPVPVGRGDACASSGGHLNCRTAACERFMTEASIANKPPSFPPPPPAWVAGLPARTLSSWGRRIGPLRPPSHRQCTDECRLGSFAVCPVCPASYAHLHASSSLLL
jgi:hypothetical protein